MSYINRDDCPYELSEYLMYLETIRNLSPRTVDGYYIDMRTFFRFFKRHRGMVSRDIDFHEIKISDITLDDIASITTADIYEYLYFVLQEYGNNPNTRARKLSSLRSFFKYMTVKSNKLKTDPVKNIEVPSTRKGVPKFLTLEESRDLLKTPQGENQLRDYCILTLFLNCGMRLSELVGINNSDVRGDQLRLLGKGNKERFVFLNDACLKAIKAYCDERDKHTYSKKDKNAMFLSSRGTRITPRRVEQIVNECLESAGLAGRGFSAHKLRHTAATLMYRYGEADMLALKEILGHEHVSTTEIYTHISDKQLKKVAESNPLADSTPPKVKRPKGAESDK